MRDMKRGANNLEIASGVRDVVIGWKHCHERVVFLAHAAVQQVRGGEADRSRGVSANGLGKDMRCCDTWKLPPNGSRLF